MHPVMKVKKSVVDGKRQYELTLSRANLNHLCANCPEVDRLVGFIDDIMFNVFPSPFENVSESFKLMPGGDGYYIYAGAEVPHLPQAPTEEEFAKLAQQAYDSMEKALTDKRIPMEEETSLGNVNLGYVVIRVEKDASLVHSDG